MYLISDETLHANQFTPSGTVRHISPTQFDMEFKTVSGFVVYIMRVKDEFMKGGKAQGTTNGSRYKARVSSEFTCLQVGGRCTVMAAGTWAAGDPWHRHAVPALRTPGTVVELFTKTYATQAEMEEDERELNDFYRGLWTKEGKPTWRPSNRPRLTDSTLRLGERQAPLRVDFRDRL